MIAARSGKRPWDFIARQALLAALLAAGTWWAWLGWDHTMYKDAGGELAGPYREWQVAGCVATLAATTALLPVRMTPVSSAVGVVVGFWVTWTAWNLRFDDSSMSGAGSALVLIGLLIWVPVVTTASWLIIRYWRLRRAHGLPGVVRPWQELGPQLPVSGSGLAQDSEVALSTGRDTTGLVLGIASLVAVLFVPFLSLVASAFGLALSLGRRRRPGPFTHRGRMRASLVLCATGVGASLFVLTAATITYIQSVT